MDGATRSAAPLVISAVILLLSAGGASGQIRGAVDPFQGMCFDAWLSSSDDGTQIALQRCHGGPNQQWRFVDRMIRGVVGPFREMCFGADQPENGTAVTLHACREGANQKWILERGRRRN